MNLEWFTLDDIPTLLKQTLPAIRSPALVQVRIICWRGVHELDQLEHFHETLEMFREVQKVQDFQLVLHAVGFEREVESAVSKLKAVVEAEKERGGFDNLFPEPLVTSEHIRDYGTICIPTLNYKTG